MYDFKNNHKDNCPVKDCGEEYTKHKNVRTSEVGVVVEYDCYCKECGNPLYSYLYGSKLPF